MRTPHPPGGRQRGNSRLNPEIRSPRSKGGFQQYQIPCRSPPGRGRAGDQFRSLAAPCRFDTLVGVTWSRIGAGVGLGMDTAEPGEGLMHIKPSQTTRPGDTGLRPPATTLPGSRTRGCWAPVEPGCPARAPRAPFNNGDLVPSPWGQWERLGASWRRRSCQLGGSRYPAPPSTAPLSPGVGVWCGGLERKGPARGVRGLPGSGGTRGSRSKRSIGQALVMPAPGPGQESRELPS